MFPKPHWPRRETRTQVSSSINQLDIKENSSVSLWHHMAICLAQRSLGIQLHEKFYFAKKKDNHLVQACHQACNHAMSMYLV